MTPPSTPPDKDKSGSVDVKELRALLSEFGVKRTEEECQALLAKVDLDHSAEVTLTLTLTN